MKILRIFLGLLFGIFFMASVNAVSVAYGEWQDHSSSSTIINGDNIGFYYYFDHFLTPSMLISVKLYRVENSSNVLVHTFLDLQTSSSSYFNSIPTMITPSDYKTPGDYYLVFSSNDGDNPSVMAINLRVNPISVHPTANVPPTLSPISNQSINESSDYSYQVFATDSDGDSLTYSFIQAPSWLSIDSLTGLITGTAPNVTDNTNFAIEVVVSDGKVNVSQSYILTVKNILASTASDTINPIIVLDSPSDNYIINVSMINFTGTVSDNMKLSNVSLVLNRVLIEENSSGINNTNYTFTKMLPDGRYNWSYRACDVSGNCVTSAVRDFIIDTVAPSINFTSLTSQGNLSQNYIFAEVTASDSNLGRIILYLYNRTGLYKSNMTSAANFSMNYTNLQEGTYYLNAMAYDRAGNRKGTSTVEIILNISSESMQNQTIVSTGVAPRNYNYYDVYNDQYKRQLNRTKIGITLRPPKQKSIVNTYWIWLAMVIFLIVMIIGVIFALGKVRLSGKKISSHSLQN